MTTTSIATLDRYVDILKAIQIAAPDLELQLELGGTSVNITSGTLAAVVRDLHQRYPGNSIKTSFRRNGWIYSVGLDMDGEKILADAYNPSLGLMSAQGCYLRSEDTVQDVLRLVGLNSTVIDG